MQSFRQISQVRESLHSATGLCWTDLVETILLFQCRGVVGWRPGMPPPPSSRRHGRNHEWLHLKNADIISMPTSGNTPVCSLRSNLPLHSFANDAEFSRQVFFGLKIIIFIPTVKYLPTNGLSGMSTLQCTPGVFGESIKLIVNVTVCRRQISGTGFPQAAFEFHLVG